MIARTIILASTSPYRASLLERLGLSFVARAPEYDEPNVDDGDPYRMVAAQAEAKARSLCRRFGDAVIIGSDQVVHLDGRVLTKPGTFDAAREQLRRLSGREHELLTAVCVIDARSGVARSHLEVSRIGIRALDDDEIRAYLDRDEPFDCAGSYMAERLGVAIFDYQRGDDPNAVVGLPLIATCRLLREHGVDVLRSPAHPRPSDGMC